MSEKTQITTNDNMRQSPTAEDMKLAEQTVMASTIIRDRFYTGEERTRIKNLAWEILRIRQHRRKFMTPQPTLSENREP